MHGNGRRFRELTEDPSAVIRSAEPGEIDELMDELWRQIDRLPANKIVAVIEALETRAQSAIAHADELGKIAKKT
jgi:hypothetical protein